MFRLILCTDWVAGRDEVLRELSIEVKNRHSGQILMVPELISHDTERRLCAAAGDTASRYAEVLSFTRLLRRVAETEQLAVPECLDNGGRLIAMASSARMLASKLKSYAAVETRPEFLAGLVDAVDEFKRCRITPEDLKNAAGQVRGTLAQKLEELSLILEGYDSICAQGKQDPRDQMNWLLEELEACDFAQRHRFYIDGFPDFTRQHMAILAHLIANSPLVTVSLTCDRVKSSRAAFEKAGQTAADILRVAEQAGVPYEIVTVPRRENGLQPVREKLFQGIITPDPALRDRVSLVRCDSVFDECQAAAQRVEELTRQGCRYRDIGLVLADEGSYQGMLSLVFRRCGIPLYLSGTDDILEKTAVATVLTALDAAMEGMEQKQVLRYLKSVLSTLTPEECDLVENYAVVWGIRGEKWSKPWTFHPDGLGGEWDSDAEQRLAALNGARERGIGPLVCLKKAMLNAKNLAGQVDALYGFLEEIHLAEGLENLALEAETQGDNRSAQEYNQLWEIIVSALEQLKSVLGESQWDPEAFSRLLKLLLSEYDVGTIPPVLDAVTAGPVSAMRCQQVRHLLVLGAVEGKLPGYAGSSGVLTDQERTELRRLGVSLTGGAMEGVAAEFAEIYGCFCGAGETVYVSCPTGQSAFVYRRLANLLDLKDGVEAQPGPGYGMNDPWEAGAYLARWNAQETAQDLGVLDGYSEAKEKAAFALGTVGKERVTGLYGKKLTLSASQIDQQAECRLAYFLRYGLKAKERKEAAIDSAEFGTFVHWVLEHTAKKVMERGGFHQVSREETLTLAQNYAREYAQERFSELDSERIQYLFQRNIQELDAVVAELWEELSQSAFAPEAYELHFGREGQMKAVPVPGKKMDAVLQGYVDRVDRFDDGVHNYFRVVDYKTGQKDFDYCDVFSGVGLQMLLYLFALEQEGGRVIGDKPTVAGVQYFPARFPYQTVDGRLTQEQAAKERAKDIRRKGLILRDDHVIQAMDPDENLTRLSCSRKKDGTIDGDVADPEQFRKLKGYVFRLIGNMVDEIASGLVDPNPYTRGPERSACKWCPYGPVCAKDREQGRRNYKTMSAQRFWEEIEKEASHHGE